MIADLVEQLRKANVAMRRAHEALSAHGPCKNNSCVDCGKTWHFLRTLMNSHVPTAEEVATWEGRDERLLRALEESVKLQSHYAQLLNDYDGGHRLGFLSAEAWLSRLDAVSGPEEPVVIRPEMDEDFAP